MVSLPFVNRVQELRALRNELAAPGASLMRVYGRRRLGKTELLAFLVKERGGLYLLVDDAERPVILASLRNQCAQQGVDPAGMDDWDGLWGLVEALGDRLVVVDEFQRLLDRNPEAVTRLQDWWDRRLKRGRAKLVLCGSSVGMMQRITRGRSGPLFGRLSFDLRLRAFDYAGVRLLYPGLAEEERVLRYAVFGGTPYYHQFCVGASLADALRRSFLNPGAPLLEEPQNLLQYELRTSRLYNSILLQLGMGTRELAEVAAKVGVAATSLGPYLQYLMKEFDLVRLDDPVLGKQRRGRYVLADPFFAFYYRFIFPNLARLELAQAEPVLAEIEAGLHGHAGKVFEEVARQALIHLNGTEFRGHPLAFDAIGNWWNRKGEELDIVAPGKKAVLVGEVKWSAEPQGAALLAAIDRKAALIEHLGSKDVIPVVVARGGVTEGLAALLAERGGFALSLADLGRIFDQRQGAP